MKTLEKKSLDELAEVMPVIGELEQKSYIGGGMGTDTCPFTQEEMDRMMASGTWEQGYVEGLGYVGPTVNIFGGSGDYYTMGEYFQKNTTHGWDAFASDVLSSIPGLGSLTSLMQRNFSNMWQEMGVGAYQQGYAYDDLIYVRQVKEGNNIKFELVDAQSGGVIISGVMSTFSYDI